MILMSELLSCPFCGESADMYESKDYYRIGCDDPSCYGYLYNSSVFQEKASAIKAWNTRVERTCHAVFDDSNWYKWICSECGQPIDRADNYCFSCGAKVVE